MSEETATLPEDVRQAIEEWTDYKYGSVEECTPVIDRLVEVLARESLRAEQAERERDEARQALENDAADLWRVVGQIQDIITARHWVAESRGSYEWDDGRYRDECRLAFDEVRKVIKDVQPPAQRRFFEIVGHEPSPIGKLRAERDALREALQKTVEQMRDHYRFAGPLDDFADAIEELIT